MGPLNGMTCAAIALGLASPALAQNIDTNKPLEELVVVASRLPTQIYKTGHTVSLLDESDIEEIGYQYGADLFRLLPGVAVSRAGGFGGLAQLRLRGADGNHLVVLVDGVDVSSAGTGEYDFAALLAGDVERIEVLRGPQSGLFGSNALAGVLNIKTMAAARSPGAEIVVEAGQNAARQGMLSATGGGERLRGRISLLQRVSEFDLSTDDSLGDEADQDSNLTLSGRLEFDASDTLSLELVGRLTSREMDTDGFDFNGGPQQGLAVDDGTFSNTDDLTLAARGRIRLADGRSSTRLSLETTRTDLDGGSFGNRASRDNFSIDSSWQWNDGWHQRSTVFVQSENERFRQLYPFDASQQAEQVRGMVGIGLEHRAELGSRVFVGATLRRDRNDEFDDATTWSFDGAWLVGDLGTRLHASVGVGVTNPTFFEQFGFVPGSFVGNPNLTPEESLGWDFGIEQRLANGRIMLDLTYFSADLENEIRSVFPSVTNASDTSKRRGLELALTGEPLPDTTISASYTYTDASEPQGRELRRPRHTGSVALTHSLLGGRARVSGHVFYNSALLDSDFRNYFNNGFMAERTELPGFTLASINASLDIGRGVRLFARIENLFDEEYEEVQSYATPGRAAYAGVRISLGSKSR